MHCSAGKGLGADFQPAMSAQMSFPCNTPKPQVSRKTCLFSAGVWLPDKGKKEKTFARKRMEKVLTTHAGTKQPHSSFTIKYLIVTGALQVEISDGSVLSVA